MGAIYVSRYKTLPLVISMSLILGSLLLSTSCTFFMHSDSWYTPKATSDGNGGAIVVYEDVKSGNERDFYAQRINPDGKTLWGDKGTLIGSSQSESYSFPVFDIVGDGTGGAIIAWPDLSPNQFRSTRYVSKVDSEGSILWQRDFEYFDRLISDGAGGAIIAFDRAIGVENTKYDETLIVIVRIDSQGDYPWGLQGVTIPRKGYWPNTLQVISDGADGVIVIWEEMEAQAGPNPPNATYTWRIMAQRIDAKCNLSWGASGVILRTNPENVSLEEPCVTSDGSGGAIVAWHQYPAGRVEGGSPEWFIQDICVQRIDSSGNILWQTSGIPLGIVKTAEGASPHTPMLVSDGSGGAIILWEDLRNGLASIYAQRVGPDGAMKWQAGGLQVCYVKSNASLFFRQVVSDGLGGAIVSCRFKEAGTGKKGTLVQKLDSAGKTVWPGNGIVVTGSDTTNHLLTSDGQGGALVGWGIDKGVFSPEKSYVQRVDSNGKLRWGAEGIKLGK